MARRWARFTGSGTPELLCDVAGAICLCLSPLAWYLWHPYWLFLAFLGVAFIAFGLRFDTDRGQR